MKINAVYVQYKYHPAILLGLTPWTIIPLLLDQPHFIWLPIFCANILVLISAGLRAKDLLQITLLVSLASTSILTLNLLYPTIIHQAEEKIIFGGYFECYRSVCEMAFANFQRLFFLSFISIATSIVMPFDKLLLFWASTKKKNNSPSYRPLFPGWSKIKLAYVVLAAINSISLLKTEFERINIVMKFRKIPLKKRYLFIFPLLIFAIKHSQRTAIALLARGFVENKKFYFQYSINKNDQLRFKCLNVILLIYLLGFVVLTF